MRPGHFGSDECLSHERLRNRNSAVIPSSPAPDNCANLALTCGCCTAMACAERRARFHFCMTRVITWFPDFSPKLWLLTGQHKPLVVATTRMAAAAKGKMANAQCSMLNERIFQTCRDRTRSRPPERPTAPLFSSMRKKERFQQNRTAHERHEWTRNRRRRSKTRGRRTSSRCYRLGRKRNCMVLMQRRLGGAFLAFPLFRFEDQPLVRRC